jgi:nucleotide-binding universal stress UspA family protein
VTLHQAPDYPSEAILAALARYEVQLVVMAAQGQSAEASAGTQGDADRAADTLVGHVARAVIERSAVPVLLLPPHYRESLPWERALVPVSGEIEGDEALALAARLGNALGLEVHVAHVLDPHAGDEGLAAKARYADAMHHEYLRRLEELVAHALPQCSSEECRRITDVALCHGDVAAELLALIERKRASLLVVGWHGSYVSGHADVLKRLLPKITIPALLVKAAVRAPFRLMVGSEIE